MSEICFETMLSGKFARAALQTLHRRFGGSHKNCGTTCEVCFLAKELIGERCRCGNQDQVKLAYVDATGRMHLTVTTGPACTTWTGTVTSTIPDKAEVETIVKNVLEEVCKFYSHVQSSTWYEPSADAMPIIEQLPMDAENDWWAEVIAAKTGDPDSIATTSSSAAALHRHSMRITSAAAAAAATNRRGGSGSSGSVYRGSTVTVTESGYTEEEAVTEVANFAMGSELLRHFPELRQNILNDLQRRGARLDENTQ
jgi:hypothetical protein